MYYTKLKSIHGREIEGYFKRFGNFYYSTEHGPLAIELWSPMFADYLLMAEIDILSAKKK